MWVYIPCILNKYLFQTIQEELQFYWMAQMNLKITGFLASMIKGVSYKTQNMLKYQAAGQDGNT